MAINQITARVWAGLRHPYVSLDGGAKQSWYSLVANHKAVKLATGCCGRTCSCTHIPIQRCSKRCSEETGYTTHRHEHRKHQFSFSTAAPTRCSRRCSESLIHTWLIRWSQGQWQSWGCFRTECGPDLGNPSGTFPASSRWLAHCLPLKPVVWLSLRVRF